MDFTIDVHNVDLWTQLGLSHNRRSRGKLQCSQVCVELDGSHPALGLDCHRWFLYLYLPEWMPEEIHVSA